MQRRRSYSLSADTKVEWVPAGARVERVEQGSQGVAGHAEALEHRLDGPHELRPMGRQIDSDLARGFNDVKRLTTTAPQDMMGIKNSRRCSWPYMPASIVIGTSAAMTADSAVT